MAALLLGAVWATSLSACLIPQDDQVIPELPPKRNSPISIVDHLPGGFLVGYPPTSCGVRSAFSLSVQDADPGDQVRSMWFIDIDRDDPLGFEARPLSLAAGQVDVAPPTASGFTSRLANLSTGIHTLTAYVTDSAFADNSANVEVLRADVTLPDGTQVADPPSLDSFSWTLEVSCP